MRLPETSRRARRAGGVVLLTAVTLLGATACADNPPRFKGEQPSQITGKAPSTVSVHTVTLEDGTQVRCIWEAESYGAGLSCDWQHKSAPTP